MKSSRDCFSGAYFLLFFFACIMTSHQSCPPPDAPLYGIYKPRRDEYRTDDVVDYGCIAGFTLMGRVMSKCQSNGEWTSPTPFCDMEVGLKNPLSLDIGGNAKPNPQILDGDVSTCFSLNKGESLAVTLDKKGVVHAIQIFMEKGTAKIEIRTDSAFCKNFYKVIDYRQWVQIECDETYAMADSVRIEDKSDTGNTTIVCEIEVFPIEVGGCKHPPPKRIANGYFVDVSRSAATLVCEEGYESDNTRIVCERNNWGGTRLQCKEKLCDPVLNFAGSTRGQWVFTDAVTKISAGTKRQLKCDEGYVKTGAPDIITCQKNGLWTKTNATCIPVLCDPLLNFTDTSGNEWVFLDDVKNFSVGTRRQLRCGKGYVKTGAPDIIICQKNGLWTETNATCTEAHCDPLFNFTDTSRNEWIFLDDVKNISVGTRKQLRCDEGYVKTGAPDTIICQKNGFWTETNATCTEVKSSRVSKKAITFGAVGIVVVLIIVGLLCIAIYFVKRRRRREAVVVYKQPKDDNGIPGTQSNEPQPPTTHIASNC